MERGLGVIRSERVILVSHNLPTLATPAAKDGQLSAKPPTVGCRQQRHGRNCFTVVINQKRFQPNCTIYIRNLV